MKYCTTLVLNSDKCFESFAAPSSPVISSYENLLRTPTPPKVTTIPEDILQVIFQTMLFCFVLLFFFSKLEIYVISDVNCYLSLGYVLVWLLRKSKFWAATSFLTLPVKVLWVEQKLVTSSYFYALGAFSL